MADLLDAQWMREAIAEGAKAKAAGDLPFGAVVVQNGTIVGRGMATDNTTGDVTDHAELRALREACKYLKTNNLSDCSIYCTNEPCIMCAAGIFQAKIPTVVIGISRDDLGHLLRPRNIRIDDLARDSSHKVTITRGVLKEEILELFRGIKKKQ